MLGASGEERGLKTSAFTPKRALRLTPLSSLLTELGHADAPVYHATGARFEFFHFAPECPLQVELR